MLVLACTPCPLRSHFPDDGTDEQRVSLLKNDSLLVFWVPDVFELTCYRHLEPLMKATKVS